MENGSTKHNMFRSLSQDAEHASASAANGVASLPFGASRRRTRAQAKLDIDQRREERKRTREAMAAMAKRPKATTPTKARAPAPAPAPRMVRQNSGLSTPPRVKIVIGASFGGNLPIEHTPTKHDPRSPPSIRRGVTVAPQVAVPTPEKSAIVSTMATDENTSSATNTRTRRLLPPRCIAQSSSSHGYGNGSSQTHTRKRMISFSPERAERPVNEEAERLKRQRNLAATEKLQLRLEGIPVRTPEKPVLPSSMRNTTPQKLQQQTPQKQSLQTPQQQTQFTASPSTASGSKNAVVVPSPASLAPQVAATAATAAAPLRTETPPSTASESQPSTRTMELPSGGDPVDNSERALPPSRVATAASSCKKELDFTAADDGDVEMVEAATAEKRDDKVIVTPHSSQSEELPASQDAPGCLSQPSEPLSVTDDQLKPTDTTTTAEPTSTTAATTIGFGETMGVDSFTSHSVIEDVGLFNCEHDVEFTGGVYGEGTDGKVSAATVRGQKVALKRAKPHDGFPEDEAKRRSAVELYYLRRVRNIPGFVQCLGLCDGIEHTCIALEVMDCKLSDYLRKYGQVKSSSSGSSSSSKRRCFTLSLEATTSMLRQICQPMAVLHDQVDVAHGDLACRNILLRLPPKGYEQKWEPVVKLSDFGRIRTSSSEPPIFERGFSFSKNCDVGSFAREILYRLLVGEIVPTNCTETRNLHKHLQDVVVESIPETAKHKLGPFYRLFMRCAGWGVRPSFREIVDHLDDLQHFEMEDNGYFPLKPARSASMSSTTESVSFLSPKIHTPSSGSKQNKYETPVTVSTATSTHATTNGVRMLPGKSFTDGSGPGAQKKTVNWLKARSVHPGGGGGNGSQQQQHQQLTTKTNNNTNNTISTTPLGRPALASRKTPPSAGASRRSLQILNQIQHRLEKEKKKC